jgi:uncharacterized protein YndB with AHSA1/START domain
MSDILDELAAAHRETGHGKVAAGEGRTVVLRRTYPAPVADVWDAITDAERIGRWFVPVTGELRLGGRFQLQGNAGGEILRCEPPHLVRVSWAMGENPADTDISEVEVRLSPDGDGHTLFEPVHTGIVDPQRWAEYGPGALGVGWDLGLLGLALHLRSGGKAVEDPEAWMFSPEARRFMTGSATAWGAAMRAGGATEEEAATATANVTAFYVPEPPAA